MPHEPAKLLRDMLDAGQAIRLYTGGLELSGFLADRTLRDAVHWNFMIIGEALSQLRRLAPEVADRISESGRIIAFRNQLIHGYGVIQPEITWSIIQDKLPTLLRELTALLSEP